jgi:hypothetical protein
MVRSGRSGGAVPARWDWRWPHPPLGVARSHPQLVTHLEEAGLRVVVPDGADPAAEVADVPLAMVRGELAIAETGSVLVSEHELGDRVVTMLCRRLVQVVDVDRSSTIAWRRQRTGCPNARGSRGSPR